jgi:hypothetical protein
VPVALFISNSRVAPPASVSEPVVILPGLLPGASREPALSATLPLIVPGPFRVAPLPTVTLPEPVALPVALSTITVPPLMTVGPL